MTLFLFILVLLCTSMHCTAQNAWTLTASNPTATPYYGETVANGQLGLVIFMPAHQPNTGVGSVTTAAQAVDTRYYNLQGIESREPIDGLNIKVTRYTDGSTRSEKILK